MVQVQIDPHLFIIFGATGNLSRRKLFPAIYNLSAKGILRGKSKVLGIGRQNLSERRFRGFAREMLDTQGYSVDDDTYRPWCDECLFYQSLDKGREEDYKRLASTIEWLEKKNGLPGNRVFYMALPPRIFPQAIIGLGKAGLNQSSGWTRLVVEKPFGQDLASAEKLNRVVHEYFDESQIFRIDHFLGKETVQNLLVFRFANAFFEHLLNRNHVASVEITVAEQAGIEHRGKYYEQTGALRDMVQNHLTQLLTLLAMEIPVAFEAEAIRNEKVKVLRQIRPIQSEDAVFGQYTRGRIDGKSVVGYREEKEVAANSQVETFVALRMEIANWRWQGVPFYLRTGKRMEQRLTRIIINFQCAPVSIFQPFETTCPIEPNSMTITLQPDEGFNLKFQVKAIGQPISLSTQQLHFKYSEAFGPLPDAYENLLLDVITGDQTLFVRYDEVEGAWKLYEALLKKKIPIKYYPAGSWGPSEAQTLRAH